MRSLKRRRWRTVLGWNSCSSSSLKVWKAVWHSDSRKVWGALSPCFRAFLEEVAFPVAVLGPVDFLAFARLAAGRSREMGLGGGGSATRRLRGEERVERRLETAAKRGL